MRHRTAFALTDIVAGTIVVVSLLALTAAAFASNGTRQQIQQNMTQLRGIHQGLVTYANSNKENYPGLNMRGQVIGATTEWRFEHMLDHHYFSTGYAIAPTDERAVEAEEHEPRKNENGHTFTISHENYSYAMLDISHDAPSRRAEWTTTLNSQAIIMSDRNCTDITTSEPVSIWHDDEWRGVVLWNDNHAAYEIDYVQETQYGTGEPNIDGDREPTDDIFTFDTNDGADALMTFSKDEDGNERAVPRIVEDNDEE